MNSYLYDDGCQENDVSTLIQVYKNAQEYWEEYDKIHSLKDKGLL